MAKAIYQGVSGVARKVKQPFVGVSGVARKVKNAFVGVSGVARQCFSGVEMVAVTIVQTNAQSGSYYYYATVQIDGISYMANSNKTTTLTVPKGTRIDCKVSCANSLCPGEIMVNGVVVKDTGQSTAQVTYTYTPTGNVTIKVNANNLNTPYGSFGFGVINIITS